MFYYIGRFKEMLIIADTCQASTLFETMETENVISIGSSLRKENSYSYTHDRRLGNY